MADDLAFGLFDNAPARPWRGLGINALVAHRQGKLFSPFSQIRLARVQPFAVKDRRGTTRRDAGVGAAGISVGGIGQGGKPGIALGHAAKEIKQARWSRLFEHALTDRLAYVDVYRWFGLWDFEASLRPKSCSLVWYPLAMGHFRFRENAGCNGLLMDYSPTA